MPFHLSRFPSGVQQIDDVAKPRMLVRCRGLNGRQLRVSGANKLAYNRAAEFPGRKILPQNICKGDTVRQHQFANVDTKFAMKSVGKSVRKCARKFTAKSMVVGALVVALLAASPHAFAHPPKTKSPARVPADIARFQQRVQSALAV